MIVLWIALGIVYVMMVPFTFGVVRARMVNKDQSYGTRDACEALSIMAAAYCPLYWPLCLLYWCVVGVATLFMKIVVRLSIPHLWHEMIDFGSRVGGDKSVKMNPDEEIYRVELEEANREVEEELSRSKL